MDESILQVRLDEVADQFLALRRQGETPDINEIAGQHPEIANEVRQFLNTIAVVALHENDSVLAAGETRGDSGDVTGITNVTAQTIGPYRILGTLGEGGMGIVFRAEQTDPIQRVVALKLIRSGMNSKQIIERFEAERRALALMDHPNIAKVLDAKATESGAPYFVMELVEGVPLTTYCDDNKLGIEQRLELFVPVCRAIQHAHHKGIIHRDLKPGNILVGMYDGVAVPKVIDFGLAKALNESDQIVDKSRLTQVGNILGTLHYMSPEQAGLNNQDVDARTDVYSLGCVLYELLTGTTPFEDSKNDSVKFPLVGLLDQLLKSDPPKPSTRLNSIQNSNSAINVERQVSPSKLRQMLQGELDWVVMKALEKNRDRRYETVGALADDVECFLNGDIVVARPPSTSYRFKKFVRKNRGWVATGTALVALTMMGLAGTMYGLVEARQSAERERNAKLDALDKKELAKQAERLASQRADEAESSRKKAEIAAKRSEDALVVFTTAFKNTSPKTNAAANEQTNAMDVLIDALEVLETSELDHIGQSKMLFSLARAFSDRGEHKLALQAAAKRLDNLEAAYGSRDPFFPDGIATKDYVPSVDELLGTKLMLSEIYQSLEQMDKSLEIKLENFRFAEEHLSTDDARYIRILASLAKGYADSKKWKEAIPLFRSAIELHKPMANSTSMQTGPGFGLTLRANLAFCLGNTGQNDQAIALYEDTLGLQREQNHYWLNTAQNLGQLYSETRQYNKAIEILQECVDGHVEKFGVEHPDTLNVKSTLGFCFFSSRQCDKAIPLYKSVVKYSEKNLGRDHSKTQFAIKNLAMNLFYSGNMEEAIPLAKELFENGDQHLNEMLLVAYFLTDEEAFDRFVKAEFEDTALLANVVTRQSKGFGLTFKEYEIGLQLANYEIELRGKEPNPWRQHLAVAFAGSMHGELGRIEKAKQMLEESAESLAKIAEEIPAVSRCEAVTTPVHVLVNITKQVGTKEEFERWTAELKRLTDQHKVGD